MRKESDLIVLHVVIQMSQYHLFVEENIPFPLYTIGAIVKNIEHISERLFLNSQFYSIYISILLLIITLDYCSLVVTFEFRMYEFSYFYFLF